MIRRATPIVVRPGHRLKPRSLHKSPAKQRLCCTQERFVLLSPKRTVYQEQIGSDDQATSEAGRSRQDAGGESIGQSEAGHQNETTLDGAFLCQKGRCMALTGHRWRGLWRVQIQEYLVSAVQNIQVLLRYGILSQDKSIGHDRATQGAMRRI